MAIHSTRAVALVNCAMDRVCLNYLNTITLDFKANADPSLQGINLLKWITGAQAPYYSAVGGKNLRDYFTEEA